MGVGWMAERIVDEASFNVGKRLRFFRIRSVLSLRQLARESDVSFATIQKIEAGAISPTVGVLMKIARGLKIKVTALLEDEPEVRTVRLIRKSERIGIEGRRQDIDIQYIAQNLLNSEMMGVFLAVGDGENSGPEPLVHGGEEIVIGIQGAITFTVGEEEYIVKSGDCLHFKCNIPHQWVNAGSKTARFYLICSEPGLLPSSSDQI